MTSIYCEVWLFPFALRQFVDGPKSPEALSDHNAFQPSYANASRRYAINTFILTGTNFDVEYTACVSCPGSPYFVRIGKTCPDWLDVWATCKGGAIIPMPCASLLLRYPAVTAVHGIGDYIQFACADSSDRCMVIARFASTR